MLTEDLFNEQSGDRRRPLVFHRERHRPTGKTIRHHQNELITVICLW